MSKSENDLLKKDKEELKNDVSVLSTKDRDVFANEYGVLLMREAMYNSKANELGMGTHPDLVPAEQRLDFTTTFQTKAQKIVDIHFNEPGKPPKWTVGDALKFLGLEEELEIVKGMKEKGELTDRYNINRITVDRIIYNAASRNPLSTEKEISMLNAGQRKQINDLIDNCKNEQDLKITGAILKVVAGSLKPEVLLNAVKGKKIELNIKASAKQIYNSLKENKVGTEDAKKQTITIGSQDKDLPQMMVKLENGKLTAQIDVSNRNLLGRLILTIKNAISPPQLIKIDPRILQELRGMAVGGWSRAGC